MQDLSASFPSLKQTDTLTAPAPAVDSVRRQWQHPLGDVHAKLNSIIGSAPVLLRFDASDADFVFELTSRWPISQDFTASTYEADIIKLADALNELVRLYAIETGNTQMHFLIEARRGHFDIPGWWVGAPCLFATYAMETGFAEVGLFSNFTEAYEDMDLLSQPHRMLVAIGPATPDMVEGTGDAWLDPDEERLRALKRWNQQMALQINTLIADIFGGGEAAMEEVVKGLSRIRDVSSRLSAQILRLEKRAYRPRLSDQREQELYDMPRPSTRQAGKLDLSGDVGHPGELAETLADLRGAIKQEAQSQSIPPEMRRELQNGLRALYTLEASMGLPVAEPAPRKGAKAKAQVKIRPSLAARVGRKAGELRQRRAAFGALAAVRRIKRVRIKVPKVKAPAVEQQAASPQPQQQKKKITAPGFGPNL